MLADIVSLVGFAPQQDGRLVPYPELVGELFQAWLFQQEIAGRSFTPEQLAWLERIRDHVAAWLAIGADDFEHVQFAQHGGLGRAHDLFGKELNPLMNELNEVLAA